MVTSLLPAPSGNHLPTRVRVGTVLAGITGQQQQLLPCLAPRTALVQCPGYQSWGALVFVTAGLRKGSGCASGTTRSALCSVLPGCSRASLADGGTLHFLRLFWVNFPVTAAVALVPGGLLSEMSWGKHLFPAPSRYRHPREALGSLSWNSSGSLPSTIFLDRAVISSQPPV